LCKKTAALKEKNDTLHRAVYRLTLLESQGAIRLLRYSLNIHKLLHTEFHIVLKSTLMITLIVEMSDTQWQQATLAVRDG